MLTDAPKDFLRPLGPCEAYFWLSNQNSAKHFIVAAEIKGTTTVASWQAALDAVQRRHPLLSVCIDTDASGIPYFRSIPNLPIPLKVIDSETGQGWEDIIVAEWETPFPVKDALLVRTTLLYAKHRATFLFAAHHSIADGLSSTFVIRDILQSLSGMALKTLPTPAAQEDLVPPPVVQESENGTESNDNSAAPAPSAPGTPLKRDPSTLQVRGLCLPTELTTTLRERARAEGVTVHGALVAAIVLAGKECRQEWRSSPVRVVSPVNTRKIVGRGQDCALTIVFPIGTYDPQSSAQFWDIARLVKSDLKGVRTKEGLAMVLDGFRQLLASKPGMPEIAQFELHACASEMMVSNLGDLEIESQFGDLKLESFWGPSVFVGMEGEQIFGAGTVNGALHLLHTSYSAIPKCLETTERILREVLA
ncbi:hypothetical protein BZG36_05320 [Bifiguratus adelaidae]|uniref:Uncharacterized protein n=1 Tax=Bifiguratus adelaidae TaxID=1938954 RepID=A0A261XU78_9FUNG|nr:hypothetical protein BZG36_05320 [Bifiguratus adelaidae]